MKTLKIVAKFVVTPETKQTIIDAVLKCQGPSRAEEGNNYYDLTESVEDENVVVILEEWKSQEAIDFHNSTEHFKELIASVTGKADVTIDVLKILN
ncbi:putative quinol monooxygenase [Rhizosphaericola mali]|uniref:Antibiotic biosynthesis monooxygenase n=1 Tax=Rhizosphaericola mali TaxID=2545455 RepID=A0A5P2G2V4_9BACT|nr:putative quinol monooxygenase [Rhizosphaericola mali]QES88130.1 antibiotic biosynthesis monooxygenase [Rhizosphaericola mali]